MAAAAALLAAAEEGDGTALAQLLESVGMVAHDGTATMVKAPS